MQQKLDKSTSVSPRSLPNNKKKKSEALHVEFEEKTILNCTLNFGAADVATKIT